MSSDDREYFLKRAQAEEIAARNAACPIARDRHTQLAALYRDRCLALGGGLSFARIPEAPRLDRSHEAVRLAESA